VAGAQKIPASVIRPAYPKGRAGVTALRTAVRLAAGKLALFDRAAQTSAAEFDLPDFDPAAHAELAGRARGRPAAGAPLPPHTFG
jgi:hypothetical protein